MGELLARRWRSFDLEIGTMSAEAASHRQAIEALERELFPRVTKLPDGPKPAKPATGDFWCGLELEAPPGFEPGVEVLQIS